MIRIDLQPPKRKSDSASESILPQVPWRVIAVFLLAFCGISTAFLLVTTRIQAQNLRRLKKELATVSPKLKKVEEVEAATRALQNRSKIQQMLKSPEAQWAPRLNILSDSIVSKLWFTALKIELPVSEKPKEATKPAQKKTKSPPKSKQTAASASSKAQKTEPPVPPAKPKPILLVLEGSALVSSEGGGSPVNRYLQRLREHPDFSRWFKEVELKSVQQRQIKDDQVSDFVIVFYPTGSGS